MKVCLINPPLNMGSRAWYPIGIGYIAAYLLKDGFEVEIIDCIGDNLSRVEFKKRLVNCKADAYGIGGLIMAFNNVLEIANMVKETYPDAIIFAGNTVASTIPEILLSNSPIQVAVMWEGEYTTVNLMNALKDEISLKTVKGIIFKDKDGNIIKTLEQTIIKDLDELPFPAWDLIPMKNYMENINYNYPISSVRGCPYNCTFCCKTFLLNKVRARSPQHIINEIIEAKKRFNIKKFCFFDDLFIYNRNRVMEFCDLKINTPEIKEIPWECSARVNLITEKMVKKMVEAKCVWIGCGFESADQDVLNCYNKAIKVDQMQNAINIMKKYNIEVSKGGTFMIGAPNETLKSIKKSVKFAKKNKIKYLPHFTTPYPGTALYNSAREKGLIKDELKFVKKIAKIGNTNFLTINLTEAFTDEELIRIKEKMTYLPTVKLYVSFSRLLKRIPFLIKKAILKGPHQALLSLKGMYRYKPNLNLEKYSNEWF